MISILTLTTITNRLAGKTGFKQVDIFSLLWLLSFQWFLHYKRILPKLVVRHAIKKPVVQIIHYGDTLPFDVSTTRTIKFNYRDLDSVADCKKELKKQIQTVEKDPTKVDSPISAAIDVQALHQSGNLVEKSNAEIMALLQDITARLIQLGKPVSSGTGWTTAEPTGWTTAAPAGWTTAAPAGWTTTAPAGWATTAPAGWTTAAPTGWTTVAPTGWTTARPATSEKKPPKKLKDTTSRKKAKPKD